MDTQTMTAQKPDTPIDVAPPINIDANAMNAVAKSRKDLALMLEQESKAFKLREKMIKTEIEKIDKVLLSVMPNEGEGSTYRSINGGTLGTTIDTNYSVSDRAAYEKWCRETGDLSLNNSSVGKRASAAYVKAHNTLPPGITTSRVRKITHNKTTS